MHFKCNSLIIYWTEKFFEQELCGKMKQIFYVRYFLFFLGGGGQIYLNFCNFVKLGLLGSIICINVLTTNSWALQLPNKEPSFIIKMFTRLYNKKKIYNCVLCKLKCNEVRYLKELVSLQVVRFSWWCG